ncbi:hypothetical protein C0992_009974 [Termitomyces sp. T32_za158]|nr:hypothetical protein C0992_009974 [Termitomyces sp. T32_za158]
MSNQLLNTAAKHPFSIIGLADRAWNSLAEVIIKLGWDPITRLCETMVTANEKASNRLMAKIASGQLKVFTLSRIYKFPLREGQGEDNEGFKAELRVISDVFWVRLCTMGDLGFAEAYMYGEVECFLSKDMTYSCAIFKDLDGDIKAGHSISLWSGGQGLKRLVPKSTPKSTPEKLNGFNNCDHEASLSCPPIQEELHQAQVRKLEHIIQKAQICPGHRVLEIGSGWGSLAILIAQTIPNTRIDTITLSVQQQALARERVAHAGLSDRIEVHLMDYRNLPPEWEGAFDRVVSVEMIEAVGAEFLERYWQVVDWAMKVKSGVGVIQVITIPEARYDRYIKEIDFIRKWLSLPPVLTTSYLVFPGGFLPTVTLLLQTMRSGSQGRLIVDSVSNIGPHYARTLREWRKRFLDRFESVIVPSLKTEYPDVMCGPRGREEIEVFKRKWIFVTVKLDLPPAPWEITLSRLYEKVTKITDVM